MLLCCYYAALTVCWGVCGWGIWGMEDGRIGRIENGGNLKLKQV